MNSVTFFYVFQRFLFLFERFYIYGVTSILYAKLDFLKGELITLLNALRLQN